MNEKLIQWDRLLPEKGIKIYPDILYKDVNDISIEKRLANKRFFAEDREYSIARKRSRMIRKGKVFGRKYNVYVYKKDQPLGNVLAIEVLDNVDGYGQGDFAFIKLVYPKYRHTKYSRYISADYLHMMFKSGIANRFYFYAPARETDSQFFLDVMDLKEIPCAGIKYSTDGLMAQRYAIVKKKFMVNGRLFALIEFNGDIFISMDLKAYMSIVPNRKQETVERWISEMDNAALKIKEVQTLCKP